jgi:hypothetical protein
MNTDSLTCHIVTVATKILFPQKITAKKSGKIIILNCESLTKQQAKQTPFKE